MSRRTFAGVRGLFFVAGAGAALLAGTLIAVAVPARAAGDALRIAPTSDATILAATTSRIRVVGPSSATATGTLITVRVEAITTVPLSGAQASVIFDRSRLRVVDVTPGEAWVAPTAMLAGFPTKEDADGLLSSANAAGMVAQFAAFFADGKSYLRAGEVELASLTFEVTACGDTRIDVPLGPLDGVLLDGRASTYGQAVELGGADSASILIDCGPTETPLPAANSSRPAVDSGSTLAATCPITVTVEGAGTPRSIVASAEGPFEGYWSPSTDLALVARDTTSALTDLRAGAIQVAVADRVLTADEANDLHYWQYALQDGQQGGLSYYIAVRKAGIANRIDDSPLVRGDDLVNFMLSAAGQSAVTSAGHETVPVPDTPPIVDYDVNLDGGVSVLDLGQVTGKWGQTSACKGWIRADVNNDGGISILDLGQVTGKWGQVGFEPPPPIPTCEGEYQNRHLGWSQGGEKWGATALLTNGPLNICGNPTEFTNAASFVFSNIEGGNGQNSIVQVGVGRCRKLLSGECDGRRKVVWAWGREAGDLLCPVQWPLPQELEVWDGSSGDAKVQREGSDWVLYWKGTERRRIPYSSTSCSWTPVRATYFTETWNDGDSNGGHQHAKYAIRHMAYQNTIGGGYSSVNTNSCSLELDPPYFCTASGDEAHTWTAR